MIRLEEYVKMYEHESQYEDSCSLKEFEDTWWRQVDENYEGISHYIVEHLKNVDPKWIIKDFEKFDCFNHYEYDEENKSIVYVYLTKDIRKKEIDKDIEDIFELLRIHLYIPKCTYRYSRELYKVMLEPCYPESVSHCKYYFHVTTKDNTNDILRVGLRPRYNNDKTFSPWQKWQKDKYDEQYSKVYLFYIEGNLSKEYRNKVYDKAKDVISTLDKRDDYCLLRVKVPSGIPLYKDNTMKNIDNCCFSFLPIKNEWIELDKKFTY